VKGLRPDGGENILEIRPFTVEEIRDRIRRNELVDANRSCHVRKTLRSRVHRVD